MYYILVTEDNKYWSYSGTLTEDINEARRYSKKWSANRAIDKIKKYTFIIKQIKE